jgi:hypothetical protein
MAGGSPVTATKKQNGGVPVKSPHAAMELDHPAG